MKVKVNKQVFDAVSKLHDTTEGFMKQGAIKITVGKSMFLMSVSPLHKVTSLDLNYHTRAELNKAYDNYSIKQINEMIALDEFPLKLTSVWVNAEQFERISIDADADSNLMELNEAIIMFSEDFERFIEWIEQA